MGGGRQGQILCDLLDRGLKCDGMESFQKGSDVICLGYQ